MQLAQKSIGKVLPLIINNMPSDTKPYCSSLISSSITRKTDL